jgi:hypothetical protein
MQSPVIKQGWMAKESRMMKSWKQRYFLLGDGFIQYYKAEATSLDVGEEGGLKGQLFLSGGKVEVERSRGRDSTLRIAANGSHIVVQAASTEDREEWMEAVQSQIEQANILVIASGKLGESPGVQLWLHQIEDKLAKLLRTLEKERVLVKYYSRMGAVLSHERVFRVAPEGPTLEWRDTHTATPSGRQSVAIAAVIEIVEGAREGMLQSVARAGKADCCMSLHIRGGRTIDLMAATKEKRDDFVQGLREIGMCSRVLEMTKQKPRRVGSREDLRKAMQKAPSQK